MSAEMELSPGQIDAQAILEVRQRSYILFDTGKPKPGESKLSLKEAGWKQSWNQKFVDEHLDFKAMSLMRKKLKGVEVDLQGRVLKIELVQKHLGSIPPSFSSLTLLEHLDLSNNPKLGDRALSTICETMESLKVLCYILRYIYVRAVVQYALD
jgi:hypothetical protein